MRTKPLRDLRGVQPGSGTLTSYSLHDDYRIKRGWYLEERFYVS